MKSFAQSLGSHKPRPKSAGQVSKHQKQNQQQTQTQTQNPRSRLSMAFGVPIPRSSSPSVFSTTSTSSSTTTMLNTNFRENSNDSNIHVYLRCRSRNEREIKENSNVVVSTFGQNGKEVIIQTGAAPSKTKSYSFEQVFGPESDQSMVFNSIAKDIIDEMLEGYNCTIFAYGQTGTGKTYTISGDISENFNTTNDDGNLSDTAGIIPRSLSYVFRKLDGMCTETPNVEYSIKVSYIEIYNEELRDLLNYNEDPKKLKIYGDNNNQITISGVEEVFIKNAKQGMTILRRGSINKQVAHTQSNEYSSRSHSLYTLTVHIKTTSSTGEEIFKVGKLNLVDLAGSENINRSGIVENKRAKEAGMINQSLLTLGRVINSLVENSPHIPYRESKLTRLLQDSLGGSTKTCIIATISPAQVNLDETLSTLEYANKAKYIKNKPKLNQNLSKKVLIKEYIDEINRLKSSLNSTKLQNGIYLSEETYSEIINENESRKLEIDDKNLRIDALEILVKRQTEEFQRNAKSINEKDKELKEQRKILMETDEKLMTTETNLSNIIKKLENESLINKAYETRDHEVNKFISHLKNILQKLQEESNELRNILSTHNKSSSNNNKILLETKDSINNQSNTLNNGIHSLLKLTDTFSTEIHENIERFINFQSDKMLTSYNKLEQTTNKFTKNIQTLVEDINDSKNKMTSTTKNIIGVHDNITNENLNELKELKLDIQNLSKLLSGDINSIKTQIQTSYNILNKKFVDTFKSLGNQISSQVSEIEYLKNHLNESNQNNINLTLKYKEDFDMLRFEEINVIEKEKVKLLNDVMLLINNMNDNRSNRIEKKFNEVDSKMMDLVSNLDNSMTNFDKTNLDLIDKQLKLKDDIDIVKTEFDKSIAVSNMEAKEAIMKINSKTSENVSLAEIKVDRNIESLGGKMTALAGYTSTANNITEEQHNTNILSIKSSHVEIIDEYKRISNDLKVNSDSTNKVLPQFETAINNNALSIKSFSSEAINRINALNNTIQQTNYKIDTNLNDLLFKRVEVPSLEQLPKPISRKDIIPHPDEDNNYNELMIDNNNYNNNSLDSTKSLMIDAYERQSLSGHAHHHHSLSGKYVPIAVPDSPMATTSTIINNQLQPIMKSRVSSRNSSFNGLAKT